MSISQYKGNEIIAKILNKLKVEVIFGLVGIPIIEVFCF